jgi:hypothetical protein
VGEEEKKYEMVSLDVMFNPNSPWPLAKILYSYLAYVHTKSWIAVLMSFYIFKVIYVTILYLDEGAHIGFFDGLGNFDIAFYVEGEPSLFSVVVIDFLWAIAGIFLGIFQSHVVDYGFVLPFDGDPTLLAAHQWYEKFDGIPTLSPSGSSTTAIASEILAPYDGLARGSRKRPIGSLNLEDETVTGSNARFWVGDEAEAAFDFDRWASTNGIDDISNVFPCGDWSWCCCCRGETFLGDKTDARWKWLHRKFYWFYFLELLLLGTPSTVVFTVHSTKEFRTGVFLYFVLLVALLICFYAWNRYYHKKYYSFVVSSSSGVRENVLTDGNFFRSFLRSKFDATYVFCLITVAVFSFLIMFKNLHANVGVSIVAIWGSFMAFWTAVFISSLIASNYHREYRLLFHILFGRT